MQRIGISIFVLFLTWMSSNIHAQCEYNIALDRWVISGTDQRCPNPVFTAVPFLSITPDARSGGLGDAGVALSGTPNSLHHNGSALAFAEKDFGVSFTYTPWLRNIVGDVYLAYINGYYKPDDIQAFGLSLKFFSMGEIEFLDENAVSTGKGFPREWEIGATYARKLSENFSMSVAGKYIYSNLASGQTIGTVEINAGTSIAADVGMQYKSQISRNEELTLGLALTNLGTKISYTQSAVGDFIPTNLALGAAYTVDIDEYNSITFVGQANKLLVPSPALGDSIEVTQDGIPEWRDQSLFSGVINSFSDAPNGFRGELAEITWTLGMEYWYDEVFAVRMGYFNEHISKGNRKYMTFGFGFAYNGFNLDMSYLVSTSARPNPLANTLRVGVGLDMSVFTGENIGGSSQDPL
jgi:hypothetical protein